MSKKAKKRLFAAIALAVIVGLFAYGFSMKPVSYSVHSDKADKGLKIVFISDLHNCFYGGTDQSGIIDRVNAAEPDMVIFGGDVIDEWGSAKHALTLMSSLSENYPCFYSPGNHEESRSDKKEFYEKVRDICPVLMGDYSELTVKGQDIRVYGAEDAFARGRKKTQLQECFDTLDDNYYNILIAHQPEQYEDYLGEGYDVSASFDLILSGHAHGGQWRIPGILEQGLFAPDQGLFPEYTTGMYEFGQTTHIISRGLARPLRMIFIPRIFNRPELSVIEING